MKETEFWGRGMEDDRPDETEIAQLEDDGGFVSTRVEDRQIVSGPRGGGHYPVGECPNPLPSTYGEIAPKAGDLPDNNPKTQYGIKKVPTHSRIPWIAIIYEGIVMALGGIKYGPFNWRQNKVAASVYVDAIERHTSLWNAGEDDDDESKVTHLAHVRACCGILIDAIETGNLVDDRPKNEATIKAIKRNYDVTNATTPTPLS